VRYPRDEWAKLLRSPDADATQTLVRCRWIVIYATDETEIEAINGTYSCVYFSYCKL